MSPLSALLVGVGGAVGAVLRFGVDDAIDAGAFPAGTLTVNVAGSFALGLVTFAGAGGDLALFVGVGACGAFTTFSSFSVETVRLFESGESGLGSLYAVGTLLGALSAVGLAWLVVAGAP